MAINNRTPALYSKLGFTVKPSVIHSWQLFKSLNKCIGLNKRTKYYASIPSLLFRESSCQCHHHRVSTRFGHQPQKGGRQLKTDTWPCDLRNRNQVPLPTETTCINAPTSSLSDLSIHCERGASLGWYLPRRGWVVEDYLSGVNTWEWISRRPALVVRLQEIPSWWLDKNSS